MAALPRSGRSHGRAVAHSGAAGAPPFGGIGCLGALVAWTQSSVGRSQFAEPLAALRLDAQWQVLTNVGISGPTVSPMPYSAECGPIGGPHGEDSPWSPRTSLSARE